jgi:hypothetical protein
MVHFQAPFRSMQYAGVGAAREMQVAERAEAHQVMVERSSWWKAETAYVAAPQAMEWIFQPASSYTSFGYMVLSPLAFSFPHDSSCSPTIVQKLDVAPQAA